MEIPFTKMHGLGNDFIVIEDLEEAIDLEPAAVAWFCDRNFGVGADGLILVRPATVDEADLFMLYHNADGSLAEMCGNGVRCFAKYAVDHGLVPAGVADLAVQTLGGVRKVNVARDSAGMMCEATVDMGAPRLAPAEIPTTLPGDQVFRCPLTTEAGTVEITAVNMGNPHAVIWVDDVDDAPVATLGPLVEAHAAFPERTNVEFAELADESRILLRVWERGVGETMACGTGACAALVAAVLGCLTGRSANVELPGGELTVRWDDDGSVYMTGPAVEVFSGAVTVPDVAESDSC